MKLGAWVLVLAATAAAVAAASADDIEMDGGVLVLTDDNFDDALKAHPNLMVEFYAPWCGHCKRLEPEYKKAAKKLKKEDPPLFLAKVDATEEEEVASRFGIRGFPTIKFFKNGKATDYEGERKAKDIVSYVVRKSGPATATLATAEEASAFVEDNEVAVVGHFASEEEEAFKTFQAAAAAKDDVPFGAVFDASVAAGLEVAAGSVAVFQKFDDGRVNFEGELEEEALANFVALNEVPAFVKFTPETARKLFSPAQPVKSHLLVFADEGEDGFDGLREGVTQEAQARRGKVLFVHVNVDEERVMDYFGVKEEDLPTAFLVRLGDSGMKKFAFNFDTVTADNLGAFADAYLAGDLKPFLKSEEVPEESDEAVAVVVGKSFDQVVLDDSKDVMVEFYAPWCGHCKALTPEYEKLGAAFADVDGVVIAKMDATANEVDHPGVNVQGFPTILFFPAGGKDAPISYDGARTASAMADFIKENAATDVSAAADVADAEDEDDEGKDEL